MITFVVAAIALFSSAPSAEQSVDLIPTDDIWVYPRAEDQDSDDYLRVWGANGASVASSAEESEEFGYALLRFNLADAPKNKVLKSATLVLTHIPKPAFSLAVAKENPLEVRPVPGGFAEKSWSYDQLSKFMPNAGKSAAFGKGAPEAVDELKEFPIRIDLMRGPGSFAKYLDAAREGGALSLALASTLSPDEGVYKVFSKDGPKEFRPILRLTLE